MAAQPRHLHKVLYEISVFGVKTIELTTVLAYEDFFYAPSLVLLCEKFKEETGHDNFHILKKVQVVIGNLLFKIYP
jgi:hypothetical protein